MPYIGGLYTGLEYVGGLVNNSEQVQMLDDLIDSMVSANMQDSIVSIFMMPTVFYTQDSDPTFENFQVVRPTKLDGYTPRNKKLLTYPYMFLTIDCVNDSKNYRYELSGDDGTIHFAVYSDISPTVEVVCCPRNYNGSGAVDNSIGTINVTEQLVMNGFPQCAFSIDTYRAWVAQKSGSAMLGLLSSGVSVSAGIATGNVVVAGIGAIGMTQQVNNMLIDSTKGSTTRGAQGGSALTAIRAKNFYIKNMSVTSQYAKMIDDYFDRYGYATDRLLIPNRSSRPRWNYVKTKNCTISGSIPADDMRKICSIYDKGITFWKNGADVGNYSLDNSPV